MSGNNSALIATAELGHLSAALAVVNAHADLNRRYRKLISDSQQVLDGPEIRRTQARGIAKKLLVLVKAAGPDFPAGLSRPDRDRLEDGLAQAADLLREPRSQQE
jgi:hypothetical protein